MAKKMKYAVSFEGYFRPSGAGIIDAISDVEALIQIENEHGYGHFQGLVDEEERTIGSITKEEILEYLDQNNGDGSDYIISVFNLSTQTMLFSCS